jgi:hypothetical protein
LEATDVQEIFGGEGNDLHHGVVGVVWSDGIATLTRSANYNCTKEELILAHVERVMSLVPEGETLVLHTESHWLASELEKFLGHARDNFSGDLSRDDVPI